MVRGGYGPWRSRISGAPLRKELRAAPHPGHAEWHVGTGTVREACSGVAGKSQDAAIGIASPELISPGCSRKDHVRLSRHPFECRQEGTRHQSNPVVALGGP